MKTTGAALLLLLPLGCSNAESDSASAEVSSSSASKSPSLSHATLEKRQQISKLAADLLNDRVDPKNTEFTDQLITALSHEDAVVRQQAAAGLGSVNFDARIIDPLLVILSSDQDGVARVYASMTITQWCTYGYLRPAKLPKRQQEILISALSDKHKFVRANIVTTVFTSSSSIVNEQSVAALGLLLKDQHEAVRSNAVASVCGLAGDPQITPLVDTLMKIVQDKNEVTHIRRDAITALMHTLDNRVMPLLQKLLQDADATIRIKAVDSIGFICRTNPFGSVDPIRGILPLLRDQNEDVRKAVISTLELVSGEDFGEDRAAWHLWYHEKQINE